MLLPVLLLLSVITAWQAAAAPNAVTHRVPLARVGGVKNHHFHNAHHRDHLKQSKVQLIDKSDVAGWLAPVTVGGQTMNLIIDTGSAALLTLAKAYHPNKSPTATDLHYTKDTKYGDGSGGIIHKYRDDVTIAGLLAEQVGINRLVTPHKIEKGKVDNVLNWGILGIGPALPHQNDSEPTLMNSLVSQHQLPVGDVTLDLEGGGGTMTFNEPFKSEFVFHDAIDTLDYSRTVEVEAFGRKNRAAIDSGTGLILMPKADIEAYAEYYNLTMTRGPYISNYYQPVGNCRDDISISFQFGQGRQVITFPSGWIWSEIKDDAGRCWTNIAGSNDEYTTWTLGVAFMAGVRVNFDYAGSRIGFWPKKL